MSAHQGDSSPDVFVFPPFAPPTPRSEPAPAPAAPIAAEPEPFELEVSVPAHDLGDPDTDLPLNQPTSWGFAREPEAAPAAAPEPVVEAAGDEGGDLPWLEMPDGGPTIHPRAEVEDLPRPGMEPDAGWMAWAGDASSTGSTAAEITPPELATAGELTSVAAVPSPAMEVEAPPPLPEAPRGFDAPDPFAPMSTAAHPETLTADAPAPAHSWPVEAMEPAALQAADAEPVVASEPPSESAAMSSSAGDSPEFAAVADRLEAVARSLRTDPGGFVAAHHDDPLALLIVGFALGQRHAGR